MSSENIYIMWLNSLIDVSVQNRHKLLEFFGGAEEVWRASSAEISRVTGINSDGVYKIMRTKTPENTSPT